MVIHALRSLPDCPGPRGIRVQLALESSEYALSLPVTQANERSRDQVDKLAKAVHPVTGESVDVAFAHPGLNGRLRQTSGCGLDVLSGW